MAKKINIEKHLIRCNTEGLPDNLVGVAVYINDTGFAQHAGIFLRYNGQSKLFHYTGNEVLLEEVNNDEWYFHKELTFIAKDLVPSVILHCDIVQKEAKPKYGFFYLGEMYDANGDFISVGHMPEYMTCVGFCLNFIKYLLQGNDFFHYLDWDISSIGKGEGYIENFIEKVKKIHPQIDIIDFKKGLRRIYPIEYVTGGFSEDLPVRKSFTDMHVENVKQIISQKLTA